MRISGISIPVDRKCEAALKKHYISDICLLLPTVLVANTVRTRASRPRVVSTLTPAGEQLKACLTKWILRSAMTHFALFRFDCPLGG